MGYMGLGMQKWIYNQRIRKPFSSRNRKSVDTIDSYEVSDLNIKGRTSKRSLSEDEREKLYDRIRSRSLNAKILNTIIALVVIVTTVLLVTYYEPWNTAGYSESQIAAENNKVRIEKQQIYELAMSYGTYQLKRNDYPAAISEFNSALEAMPDDKEARSQLLTAYIQDCINNNNNCKNAEELLDSMIKDEPDNLDYQSYKIELENMTK